MYGGQFTQIAYQMEEDANYRKCCERIDTKFNSMKDEIHAIKLEGPNVNYSEIMEQFKQQKLPLARIKKIMKSDEEVRVSLTFCTNLVF